MLSRPRHLWRSVRRRFTAAGALIAYLAAALGLPMPAVTPGGNAVACQGRLCGCQTAEDGSRRCCCHAAAPSCPSCAARGACRHDVECPHCSGRDPNAVCIHGMSHGTIPSRIAAAAPGCRCQTAPWVFIGAVPAVAPAGHAPIRPVVAERLAPANVVSRRLTHAPPLPPPRTSFHA